MDLTKEGLASLRKGGTEKQGREQRYDCPRCRDWRPVDGRFDTLGVDVKSGVFGCWFCGFGGVVVGMPGKKSKIPRIHRDPDIPTAGLPDVARAWLRGRGLDVNNTIARYRLAWDGRICWPCGEGYGGGWARRYIVPHSPKVWTDADTTKGAVIGAHRMVPGCTVVFTEGDCKAASIPHPWVGVGLIGTRMHEEQARRIILSGAVEGIWMLDGGVKVRAPATFRIQGFPQRFVEGLPPGKGPDDVPTVERVRLLLEAKT